MAVRPGTACQPGGTTMVDQLSSMIAGPRSRCGGARRARSWRGVGTGSPGANQQGSTAKGSGGAVLVGGARARPGRGARTRTRRPSSSHASPEAKPNSAAWRASKAAASAGALAIPAATGTSTA